MCGNFGSVEFIHGVRKLKCHVIAGIACTRKLSKAIASISLPDWGSAAQLAFQTFFPQILLCCFLLELERICPIALSQGIDI